MLGESNGFGTQSWCLLRVALESRLASVLRLTSSRKPQGWAWLGGGWHIYLLWSISHIKHARWFEEELKSLAALASWADVPVSLDISIHATGRRAIITVTASHEELEMGEAPEYEGPGEIHEGRPNVVQWFQHIRGVRAGLDAAVNLCGPRSLIHDARKAAAHGSEKDGLFHAKEEEFVVLRNYFGFLTVDKLRLRLCLTEQQRKACYVILISVLEGCNDATTASRIVPRCLCLHVLPGWIFQAAIEKMPCWTA